MTGLSPRTLYTENKSNRGSCEAGGGSGGENWPPKRTPNNRTTKCGLRLRVNRWERVKKRNHCGLDVDKVLLSDTQRGAVCCRPSLKHHEHQVSWEPGNCNTTSSSTRSTSGTVTAFKWHSLSTRIPSDHILGPQKFTQGHIDQCRVFIY